MSIGGVRLQFSDVRLQFSDVGLGPLDIPENSSCPRYKLIAESIIVVKVRNITVSSHSFKSQFQVTVSSHSFKPQFQATVSSQGGGIGAAGAAMAAPLFS